MIADDWRLGHHLFTDMARNIPVFKDNSQLLGFVIFFFQLTNSTHFSKFKRNRSISKNSIQIMDFLKDTMSRGFLHETRKFCCFAWISSPIVGS